jgi:hypothetical protein
MKMVIEWTSYYGAEFVTEIKRGCLYIGVEIIDWKKTVWWEREVARGVGRK